MSLLLARVGGGDTTAPTLTISINPDRTKISDEAGVNTSAFSFQVNEAYAAYQIRKVTNATDPVSAGTLIESGSGGSADTNRAVNVTQAELTAAGIGDGTHRIKVFAQDMAGNWST